MRKFLLVIAFLLILPGLASADKGFGDVWGTDCPHFMSGQDCNLDYITALGPKVCTDGTTMGKRNTSCTSLGITGYKGVLHCDGSCYWQTSATYCDTTWKRSNKSVSKSLSGTSFDFSPAPDQNVSVSNCSSCLAGFTDYGDPNAKCEPILDDVMVAQGTPNTYYAVPVSGARNVITIGSDLWTTDDANVWRLTGNVGIGTETPFAKLHAEGTDTWVISSRVQGTMGLAVMGSAKDTATNKEYFGTLAVLNSDGGSHFGGSFQGPGGRVKIGTDTDAIQLVLGNLDVQESKIYNSGSLNVVHIGGKIMLGDVASNTVSGDFAMAMGKSATASGAQSVAMGYNVEASGGKAMAFGDSTTASGAGSVATGQYSVASGLYSTAMGQWGVASGNFSTALGYSGEASDSGATAIGYNTEASGASATALGHWSEATGDYSTALGYYTTAQAYRSVVVGSNNIISGTTGSWVSTEPIFVVGNGQTSSPRSNAMTILKNGKVGIGLTDPSAKLHVDGGTDIDSGVNYATYPGYVVLGDIAGVNLALDDNEIMARNGASTATLYINNDGGAVYVSNVLHGSDRRLKKDIEPLGYGLGQIMQLKPVSFNWKNKENEKRSIGLIAQDVEPIMPELVFDTPDEENNGMLGLNYTELTPVLINAIQELKAENDALKAIVCEIKPEAEICNE